MLLVYVGPERPMGLALEARRDPQGIRELALVPPVGSLVETVAHNLEGQTEGILDYRGIKEVPIEYQIHIVGVMPRVH